MSRRRTFAVIGGSLLILVLGVALLAIVGSYTRPHSLGPFAVSCSLPNHDVVIATGDVCQRLGGRSARADNSDAAFLYTTWKANNRTNHNRAYLSARIYLEMFPEGEHVAELKAWAGAYQRVMKSMALITQKTPSN
jgi:hypothetical protein